MHAACMQRACTRRHVLQGRSRPQRTCPWTMACRRGPACTESPPRTEPRPRCTRRGRSWERHACSGAPRPAWPAQCARTGRWRARPALTRAARSPCKWPLQRRAHSCAQCPRRPPARFPRARRPTTRSRPRSCPQPHTCAPSTTAPCWPPSGPGLALAHVRRSVRCAEE
jgi:hypothetical protein